MKKNNSFVKQATILAVAGLLSRFLGFLYRIPLTNMLGNDGIGIYGAGYNIYQFLLILSSAGLPAAIAKMVSERRARGEHGNAHMVFNVAIKFALAIGFTTALIMWFGAKFFSEFINSPRSYYTILTLSPTVFIVALLAVYRGYFQGMGNAVPTGFSQVAEQIFNAGFSLLLAFILIKTSVDLGAAGATAGTGIGAAFGLLMIYFVYRLARPRIMRKVRRSRQTESSSDILKDLIATALPIIAGAAVFAITNIIDTKMVMELLMKIENFTEDMAYDYYGRLSGKYVTLVNLPVSISTSIATAVIPSIAASIVLKNKEIVKKKIDIAIKLTMLISIPSAVGMGVLGAQILQMLFHKYPEGGELFSIGAVSIVLIALCQILTGILQGTNNLKVPLIGAIFGSACKIIVNLLLIPIPEINILGAVISTICCYIVAAGINLAVVMHKMKYVPDFIGTFLKPFAAAAVMGIACYCVYHGLIMIYPSNTVAVMVSILLGIGVYFIFMILIGGIAEEELALLPYGDKLIRIVRKIHF